MKVFGAISNIAVVISTVTAQFTASRYYESLTGITYSSITHTNGATYRVALPITSNASDAILSVVAPKSMGWCAMAWGGRMVNNPLSVNWATGANTGLKAIVSSRWTETYSLPSPWDGAKYTYLKGTGTNNTHWTVTTRCQGCTRFNSSSGYTEIDTRDSTMFAYACSTTKPTTPSSNTSNFQVHDTPGIWTHDLTIAKNSSYATWIAKNTLSPQVLSLEIE